MNLQFFHSISDVVGRTGQRIVRAVVAGPRDPQVLANRERVVPRLAKKPADLGMQLSLSTAVA